MCAKCLDFECAKDLTEVFPEYLRIQTTLWISGFRYIMLADDRLQMDWSSSWSKPTYPESTEIQTIGGSTVLSCIVLVWTRRSVRERTIAARFEAVRVREARSKCVHRIRLVFDWRFSIKLVTYSIWSSYIPSAFSIVIISSVKTPLQVACVVASFLRKWPRTILWEQWDSCSIRRRAIESKPRPNKLSSNPYKRRTAKREMRKWYCIQSPRSHIYTDGVTFV